MSKVTFDYSKAGCFIADHEVEAMKPLAEAAAKTLTEKTGAGNDFLGWIDLPVDYDKEEFARIKAAAKKIQEDSEVLLVILFSESFFSSAFISSCWFLCIFSSDAVSGSCISLQL